VERYVKKQLKVKGEMIKASIRTSAMKLEKKG
jgi:hypothetical protein